MHVLCIKYIVVVANLAPRAVQLNRKKYISPVHVVFAPKNLVLARQVRPYRPR